jgi:hypothetical protein
VANFFDIPTGQLADGGSFFQAYADAAGAKKRTYTRAGFLGLSVGPFGTDVQSYSPEDIARFGAAAQKAYDRRMPLGEGVLPDYTDALMQRMKSAELIRLGIGNTRQSTFTLSPAAAILSGY